MADYVVGLTGGIGSGKTAVSDAFAALGIAIADADVASRDIMVPGEPAYEAVVARHGTSLLLDDKSIDRAQLRSIVFANPDERKWLEGQTVPRIMERLVAIIREAASPYAMLVLSTGRGKNPLMNRMLLVDVAPETQLARVQLRDNNSEAQVRAIMATQPKREERLEWADDVIVNDGDLADLQAKVQDLHAFYLTESKA